MIEYENYRQQMRLPDKNQDLERLENKVRADRRKACKQAFVEKMVAKWHLQLLVNRIMIRRLNAKCAAARQYSLETLSKVYVFRDGRDFVCLRSADIRNRNRYSRKSYPMSWVADNSIAVYYNGKCVEHKNFTFNDKIKF